MRRMTTVVPVVARCRVDFLHVLTKDLAVIGAQLCLHSLCLPWLCLFGCSNGRRRPISNFDELLSMAVVTASWWTLLIADL